MCSASANLLSISSGCAQLLERGIKSKLCKKVRKKLISHTEESCLACPLRVGKELCVYLLVDIQLSTMVQVASKSALPLGSPVDVICGSLPVKLYPDKLVDGYSRCISFSAGGGSLMTPCEYERRAGRTTAKNWKKPFITKENQLITFFNAVLVQMAKSSFILSPLARHTHVSLGLVLHSKTQQQVVPPLLFHHQRLLSSPLCHLLHPQQVLIHQLLHQPTVTNRHLSHHQIYQSSPLCHLLHQQQVLIHQLLHQ